MDTLLSIKVFCQVVQSNSFTRAAELLNISTPMASKHVSHLEKHIGTQLLYRNNRHLKLTEQGEAYYREASLALEILSQAANQATVGVDKPIGTLRVSVPVWFACNTFAKLMTEFRQLYPEIELQLTLTNKHVDLNSDGEDVALRLSYSLAENLIARKLGHLWFVLVASPDYVAQHGLPKNPDELQQHWGILPTYTDMSHQVMLHNGQQYTFELASVVRTNHTLMVAEMIRAGAGIGYMPIWVAQNELQTKQLIHVLPEYTMPEAPLYAVYTNRQFMNAKVRAFIDFLVTRLQ